MTAGREIDLQLHLLDRQVIDRDSRIVCKVDDLELEPGADGQPYVTAILVGARAVGPRFRGRLGRWWTSIGVRLGGGPEPARISFTRVTEIGDDIRLDCSVEDLDVRPLEDWVRRHVIAPIPGSRHASE